MTPIQVSIGCIIISTSHLLNTFYVSWIDVHILYYLFFYKLKCSIMYNTNTIPSAINTHVKVSSYSISVKILIEKLSSKIIIAMQEFTFHIVEVAFSDLQMYAKKYLALIFSKIYCLESYIANTFILKIEGYTT